MSEEEILKILNSYKEDVILKSIRGLLDLYKAEKEKNKELEEKLKNEQISHKNDSDSMNEINEKITQDTVDCLKIIDKYRFCKVEKLKDFYKEIKEIFEGE